MKKTGLVTKREYLRRVNKKSFILLTLFTPVLFAALVFVPLRLSSIKGAETYDVMVADRTGKYASLFKDTDKYHFVRFDDTESLERLRDQRNGIYAFVEITDDLLKNPHAVSVYSDKQVPLDLKREVNHVLSAYLEEEKRASFNIPNLDEIIRESRVQMDVQTIKWSKGGEAVESSSEISGVIGMVFTFIIFMFIMTYGVMVMSGVMEEKTNRIVELMVSSVRPFDLLMGKIIGIGLVGLTQVFIWCVLTVVLIAVGGVFLGMGAGGDLSAVQQGVQASPVEMKAVAGLLGKLRSFNFVEILCYFVLYFVGGYVIYASLFAAIGSAVDNPEDSQQFIAPMMVIMIFAFYVGIYSVKNPDGPLAFWCSLVPFTAPVVMMVRIPHEIPFWQIGLSLTALYASALFFVWLSARIYRIGILMYGKKPSLKEIIRWVKYYKKGA
jgi:ABC-2 type transport system permease protein